MPETTVKYYRWRKVYSPMLFERDDFHKIRRADENIMEKDFVRKNGESFPYFYEFSYIDERGNKVYEYYESEEERDLMEYTITKDKSCLNRIKERELLRKHK